MASKLIRPAAPGEQLSQKAIDTVNAYGRCDHSDLAVMCYQMETVLRLIQTRRESNPERLAGLAVERAINLRGVVK